MYRKMSTKKTLNMNSMKNKLKLSLKKSWLKRNKKPEKDTLIKIRKDMRSSITNLEKLLNQVSLKIRQTETNSPHYQDGTVPDHRLKECHLMTTSST